MGYFYKALKKIAYKGLDIVTLGNGVPVKINNFKLKLPTKYFRLFPKTYEPTSFEFFKKHAKPGSTILDIGAHIGLYSIFFYKITKGKIFSFEPTPSTVEVLKKTIQVNNAEKNVTVVQAAVAETSGVATFYSNDLDASQSNSLVDLELSDSSNRKGAYQVNVLSVDQFRTQEKLKIDVLKIDAEGVELDVLKGAKETFLQDRPVAVLGLHPFAYQNRAQMLDMIWTILSDYKMQVQTEGQTITKEQFCSNPSPIFDVELLPQ
jgi:FkbM family methyltransferase